MSARTYAYSINASGQVAGYYRDASYQEYGFVYSDGTFTPFGPQGARYPFAFNININASGQVAGSYRDTSDQAHGFLYSDGTFTTLDVLGATGTLARSINARGQITGYYIDDSGSVHSFVYSNSDGTFTTLDVPGATSTVAFSINDSGQVTGSYVDDSGGHGFIATPEPCDEVTIASLIVTPTELWPPNHKMVPVAVTVSAHDSCGSAPAGTGSVQLLQ